MKKKLPPDIAVMAICFIITWVDRNSSFNLPTLMQSYLADLFCIPLILFITLSIVRSFKKNRAFRFSMLHVLFAFVWISVLCEWIIPVLFNHYVADGWDVVMYAMGSFFVLLRQHVWFRTAEEIKSLAA